MLTHNEKLLYLVTDRTWLNGGALENAVEEAIRGGVNIVQLREKNASREEFAAAAWAIKDITRAYNVPLIINDSIEIAVECGAEGVHLGASDTDVAAARAAAGGKLIIGASARTVESAKAAERKGADYLGAGAVFGTATKSDAKTISVPIFKSIAESVAIPVVAIGGVNESNVLSLKDSGASGIAVVSAILSKPDKRAAAESLKELLKQI